MRGDEDMARLHKLVGDDAPPRSGPPRAGPGPAPVGNFSYGSGLLELQAVLGLIFPFIGVVVIVAGLASGSGPPVWFGVAWFAGACWIAYWFAFRLCGEVRVAAGRLHWHRLIGHDGSAPLDAVAAVTSPAWDAGGQLMCIRLRGGRPVLIFGHKGAREFATSLRAVTGRSLPIDLGWQVRLGESIGLRSWYREEGVLLDPSRCPGR